MVDSIDDGQNPIQPDLSQIDIDLHRALNPARSQPDDLDLHIPSADSSTHLPVDADIHDFRGFPQPTDLTPLVDSPPATTIDSKPEVKNIPSDEELRDLAINASKSLDFDKAEENIKEIKDKAIRLNALADIIQYFVDIGDFDAALEFTDLIDDKEYHDTVSDRILNRAIVNKPRTRSSPFRILNRVIGSNSETQPNPLEDDEEEDKDIVASPVADPGVIEKKKLLEGIDLELEEARFQYAQAKVDYRKKDRENWKWMKDIRAGLGFEKTTSDILERVAPKNMEEVKRTLEFTILEYNKVKKEKRAEIFSIPITSEEIEEVDPDKNLPYPDIRIVVFKSRAVLQAEKEWDDLQAQISELEPSGQESETIKRLKKGLALWSKVPVVVRLSVVPALIGTTIAFLPAGGLVAGASYAGLRVARGVGGLVGSRVAGSVFESKANEINKSDRQEDIDNYKENVLRPDEFETSEVDYMSNREEEKNKKKRQSAAKAVFMVAAGAGTGILAGLTESSLSNLTTISTGGGSSLDNAPKGPRVGVPAKSIDGIVRPKSPVIPREVLDRDISAKPSIGLKPKVPESDAFVKSSIKVPEKLPATRSILGTKVDVSSKGFIQTFADMKAKVVDQYGGVDRVPPQIKANILDKSSIELAKEFHLYDPEKNISGVGYKGESLSMNDQGDIVYKHLDGKVETLFDSKTGEIHEFSRSIKAPLLQETSGVSQGSNSESPKIVVEPETTVREAVVDEPVVVQSPIDEVPRNHSSNTLNISPLESLSEPKILSHIPYNDSFVDVTDNGIARAVVFKGIEIAHEHPFGSGKILSLDDRFQEGVFFKDSREAFAVAFEKNVTTDIVGKNPIAVPFEGGKIYIVHDLESDPSAVKVLLNGKEIAKGVLTEKGPKIEINSSLKGGFLRPDSVYERAFKQIRPIIKDLAVSPNNLKIAA